MNVQNNGTNPQSPPADLLTPQATASHPAIPAVRDAAMQQLQEAILVPRSLKPQNKNVAKLEDWIKIWSHPNEDELMPLLKNSSDFKSCYYAIKAIGLFVESTKRFPQGMQQEFIRSFIKFYKRDQIRIVDAFRSGRFKEQDLDDPNLTEFELNKSNIYGEFYLRCSKKVLSVLDKLSGGYIKIPLDPSFEEFLFRFNELYVFGNQDLGHQIFAKIGLQNFHYLFPNMQEILYNTPWTSQQWLYLFRSLTFIRSSYYREGMLLDFVNKSLELDLKTLKNACLFLYERIKFFSVKEFVQPFSILFCKSLALAKDIDDIEWMLLPWYCPVNSLQSYHRWVEKITTLPGDPVKKIKAFEKITSKAPEKCMEQIFTHEVQKALESVLTECCKQPLDVEKSYNILHFLSTHQNIKMGPKYYFIFLEKHLTYLSEAEDLGKLNGIAEMTRICAKKGEMSEIEPVFMKLLKTLGDFKTLNESARKFLINLLCAMRETTFPFYFNDALCEKLIHLCFPSNSTFKNCGLGHLMHTLALFAYFRPLGPLKDLEKGLLLNFLQTVYKEELQPTETIEQVILALLSHYAEHAERSQFYDSDSEEDPAYKLDKSDKLKFAEALGMLSERAKLPYFNKRFEETFNKLLENCRVKKLDILKIAKFHGLSFMGQKGLEIVSAELQQGDSPGDCDFPNLKIVSFLFQACVDNHLPLFQDVPSESSISEALETISKGNAEQIFSFLETLSRLSRFVNLKFEDKKTEMKLVNIGEYCRDFKGSLEQFSMIVSSWRALVERHWFKTYGAEAQLILNALENKLNSALTHRQLSSDRSSNRKSKRVKT